MRMNKLPTLGKERRLAQLVVASLGVISILGSGGGIGDLYCFDACIDLPPPSPAAFITPQRMTVQVGAAATFTANVTSFATPGSVSLQWCRMPKGAASCTDIAGATDRTLTWPNATLGDDGTQFQLKVTDANGTSQAHSILAVSSAPGVVFADANFAEADWSVTAVIDPAQSGATHSESQATTGGNPGAFRSVTYVMPQTPASVRLFHTSISGEYDPAAQGAIYVIDFAMDCARLAFEGVNQVPSVIGMIEQGGRRYIPASDRFGWESYCSPQSNWETALPLSSVSAGEFTLTDGPACGPAEACPDFSSQAAPIRVGFRSSAVVISGTSPGSVVQGIDNWKVTVWRR